MIVITYIRYTQSPKDCNNLHHINVGYYNLLTLSVPDVGYYNLLTLSVSDVGYYNLLTLSVPDVFYYNLLTLKVKRL
jgi:hypothetical protein